MQERIVDIETRGLVGYCLSGRFVFRCAGAFADRVAASISVYGARLVTDLPDSAHLLADRIQGEMHFLCAEHDHYITPQALDLIQSKIDAGAFRGRIEYFPESEHGFAFLKRRAYHKASAERHWERLFEIFARTLRAGT